MYLTLSQIKVFSAYRFVKRAVDLGIPIAIINKGETRAERSHPDKITLKSDQNSSRVLKGALELLR